MSDREGELLAELSRGPVTPDDVRVDALARLALLEVAAGGAPGEAGPLTKSALIAKKTALGWTLGALVLGAAAGSVATRYALAGREPRVEETQPSPGPDVNAPVPPALPPSTSSPGEPSSQLDSQSVAPSARESAPVARRQRPHEPSNTASSPRTDTAEAEAEADLGASERAAERALLRRAQVALARGRPEDALDVLRQHATQHWSSDLTEERLALEVSALRAAGRDAEAGQLRERFLTQYPNSLFRDWVAP
jgi:hypothetical protein